ncbi:hypothetical protein RUM44_006228 [Polyplax serrata]|uniref:Catenin delta-2 n=1 Tax=Polyplax serrata TaxID=468196 RepID=A0ABR1AHI7_POLSC
MPQYGGQSDMEQSSSYPVDMPYHGHGLAHSHTSNGHPDNSPSSSHLSLPSEVPQVVRSQKQQTTQQVTTVTKVLREVHRVDTGQALYSEATPVPGGQYQDIPYGEYGSQEYPNVESYRPSPGYQEYEHYSGQNAYPYPNPSYNYPDHPAATPSPSESPSQQPIPHDYLRKPGGYPPGFDEFDPNIIPHSDHYRITPSPDPMTNTWNMSGDPNQMPPGDATKQYGYAPAAYGPAYGTNGSEARVFEERVAFPMMAPQTDDKHHMRWRDPNLAEVIGFLSNSNNVIKANAAAYLQHLCYMDDPNKQKTRSLGGIPPLVKLLTNESPDVCRNACGALRNLSYGRQNDENKRVIKNAGGIPALIGLLRKSNDAEVKELVTGVLWNLSSCEDLKRSIIDDGLTVIVNHIIIPHSGWDPTSPGDACWSTMNVSSAGEYARRKLRECEGLVDSLMYVMRCAIEKSNIGNKSMENCVCILRNLSYRCQEVEDENYDKQPFPAQQTVKEPPAQQKGLHCNDFLVGENLGCFGASKKKKENNVTGSGATGASSDPKQVTRTARGNEVVKGMDLIWQPEVVHSYLQLLQSCSNPETLEAAAGALQNLAACYWQPSIEIRAAVRKEKGLPILVELLRMEVDRVVCAVATALRNLAIDQRNKELIGKYAMRDLVQKLPSGSPQHDQGTSDDTIAAVLATLNEVIKKNAEFSRSLLEFGGVERLMSITRQRQKYTARVVKFAGQVLFTMWQHAELREVYKKHGWKEADFVSKTVAARNAGPNSPNNVNSTLNRPMASQGGTRYEDRTITRPHAGNSTYRSTRGEGDELAMGTMAESEVAPPAGGVRIFPPGLAAKPGEPLYAQVNREKKKNRQYEGGGGESITPGTPQYEAGGDHWQYDERRTTGDSRPPAGGDSWV